MMARKRTIKLHRTALKILEVIDNHWPTNSAEIGAILEPGRKDIKSVSGKYMHHLRKLKKMGLIQGKRLGPTLVVWPNIVSTLKEKVEKLKAIRRDIDSLVSS